MKFNWNPALFSEAVRQVVLVLVLFGVVNWTAEMQAGILMALSAILALFTITNTTPNSMLETAGTSKTQVVEAARQNVAAGTPGGTGTPNTPGGAGGVDAPSGLGNFSGKDRRGTGAGLLLLVLIPSLIAAACSRPITPAQGAAVTKDVLTLANDLHKAVFDGYVEGRIPGNQADPFMHAVEVGLVPAARKTLTALRAWQAATTIDLKKIKAGDLTAALDLLQSEATKVFGLALPEGIRDNVASIATSIRNTIATLRQAIADARADNNPAPVGALAPA